MVRVINLCNKGGCCPTIEIGEHVVHIGEEGNLCTLQREEWDVLVDKIRNNEI